MQEVPGSYEVVDCENSKETVKYGPSSKNISNYDDYDKEKVNSWILIDKRIFFVFVYLPYYVNCTQKHDRVAQDNSNISVPLPPVIEVLTYVTATIADVET